MTPPTRTCTFERVGATGEVDKGATAARAAAVWRAERGGSLPQAPTQGQTALKRGAAGRRRSELLLEEAAIKTAFRHTRRRPPLIRHHRSLFVRRKETSFCAPPGVSRDLIQRWEKAGKSLDAFVSKIIILLP